MRIAFFVAATLLMIAGFTGVALLLWTNRRPPDPPRRPPIVIINATGASGEWGAGQWPAYSPPYTPQEQAPPYRIIGREGDKERGTRHLPPRPALLALSRPSPPRPRQAHNRAEDPPELVADVKSGMSIRQLRRKWGIGYKRAKRLVKEYRERR